MNVIKQGIRISIALLIGLLTLGVAFKKKEENKKLLFPPVVVYAQRPRSRIKGDLRKFLNRMAITESGNNAKAVNRYGMMGKYQFSPNTLRSLGFHTTKEAFLNNEDLQDSAMIKYMKSNARELQPVIREFSGHQYRGILITKSGIIAAAHLTGTVGVLAYFYPDKYHHRLSDGNGTTVTDYIQKFNNYQLNF